jgi:histidinol dehydrogenase
LALDLVSGLRFRRYDVSKQNPDADIKRIADEIRKPSIKEGAFSSSVADIIELVRNSGDAALMELANKFDKSNFVKPSDFYSTSEEMRQAYSKLDDKDVKAMKMAFRQIRFLAKSQMKRFVKKRYVTPLGFSIEESYEPLGRVGAYVPGGLASYPSTVLMICAAAAEAGIKDIIIATPARGGIVNPKVLAAADLCGVKEILKVGGAQAIAALAQGTKSVRKVDLIVGPGNDYVSEAKRQVASSGLVSIDMLAGPTELLVIADSQAKPQIVYEDIISQAEHGNRTLCGVVSDSDEIIDQVLEFAKDTSQRRERMEEIIQSTLFAVKTNSIDQAVTFASLFSPEHLEVMMPSMTNEKKFRHRLMANSGIALLGEYVPCSATDYIVGTNHILPTNGDAKRQSGLSVETFLKRSVSVRGSKKSLGSALTSLSNLAGMEGLPNHARAAKLRFDRVEGK